jgi:hypothetical protein
MVLGFFYTLYFRFKQTVIVLFLPAGTTDHELWFKISLYNDLGLGNLIFI